jgi:hypothetical protein
LPAYWWKLLVSLKQRIEDVQGRKERLDEAFLYEKAIDRPTYEQQRDKLNEQIVLAEMQERETKLEDYDVESVLNFTEHIVLNAARLWVEFSSDQKQRLQKVLFPDGVQFDGRDIKTAATCLLFKLLPKDEEEKLSLATLPGIEPGLPP